MRTKFLGELNPLNRKGKGAKYGECSQILTGRHSLRLLMGNSLHLVLLLLSEFKTLSSCSSTNIEINTRSKEND